MSTENMNTVNLTAESGTLGDVRSDQSTTREGSLYGRMWRGVPRDLGFLVLAMPLAVAGLVILNPIFFTGVGTLIIYIGFFLVLGALYVARGFGTLQLVRLRWAGRPEITRPQWRPVPERAGFIRRTFYPLTNGHYWLYLLHGMIINPIVGIFSWTLTIVWVSISLGGTTYWFWDRFLPENGPHDVVISRIVYQFFLPGGTMPVDARTGDYILYFAAGILFLVTLPFVTRGLVLLNNGIARGLLGAWRSEALAREVADLSASRGAAVAAEDVSLRRLERDIHDGPQQRLVRLQMDLAAAERRLASGEADAARALLAEARGQAGETLDELRALSRGFAPPILQDRGLVVALESLAARSTVPVTLENTLDAALRLPGEIERSAYFIAAELLTNVVKHSGASAATLKSAWEGDAIPGGTLHLWVADNGHGGAAFEAGHGLRGLEERLAGLRGSLTIDSPIGGPTIAGAHIPAAPPAEGVHAGGAPTVS